MSDRQHTPHLVQATAGRPRTKPPNGVRTGRSRPADSTLSRQIAAIMTFVGTQIETLRPLPPLGTVPEVGGSNPPPLQRNN
jgi:hypothetical protein